MLADCFVEEAKCRHVFRMHAHTLIDGVGAARYALAVKPTVTTVVGINQDCAWGRDSGTASLRPRPATPWRDPEQRGAGGVVGGTGSVLAPVAGSIVFEFIRNCPFAVSPYTWQLTLGAVLPVLIFLLRAGLWTRGEPSGACGADRSSPRSPEPHQALRDGRGR